jgi:hypothetical protein
MRPAAGQRGMAAILAQGGLGRNRKTVTGYPSVKDGNDRTKHGLNVGWKADIGVPIKVVTRYNVPAAIG